VKKEHKRKHKKEHNHKHHKKEKKRKHSMSSSSYEQEEKDIHRQEKVRSLIAKEEHDEQPVAVTVELTTAVVAAEGKDTNKVRRTILFNDL
jgi:hypothetical protein